MLLHIADTVSWYQQIGSYRCPSYISQ